MASMVECCLREDYDLWMKGLPIEELFWSRVAKHPGEDCWYWQGKTNGYGYGQLRGKMAHKYSYELHIGPVPEGLDLDHLCRNRACVNPDHLEPVTRRENLRRGMGFPGINARKTHCKHGHEFTPENTYVYPGKTGHPERFCRQCRTNTMAARRLAGIA